MNWQVISLIVITLLGLAIRLINIDGPLWLDELHSSWSVSGSLGEVAQRAGDGNQPPLYYWVAWFVVQVLGQTEFTLRLVSLIPGVAMIPVAWAIVNRFSRSTAGSLLAAALIAFDPELIFFSTEFRSYICVTFVGMIQIAVFAHLLCGSKADDAEVAHNGTDEDKRSKVGLKMRLLFCGLTILLVNLHITAILLLLPEIIITLIAFASPKYRKRYSPFNFLCDGGIIAAGCLPLALLVMGIEAKREDWAPMVRVWPLNSGQIDFLRLIAGYVIPLIVICSGYGAFLFWTRRRPSRNSRRKVKQAVVETHQSDGLRVVIIMLACTVMLIGTVWLLTFFQVASLFLPRYVSVLLAVPAIAVGVLVGVFQTRFSASKLPVDWILALAMLAVIFFATQQYSPWARNSLQMGVVLPMRHEPWGNVVDTLNIESDPNKVTPVFLMSTLVEDYRLFSEFEPTDRFVEYCRFPLSGIYRLDRTKHNIIPIPSLIDREVFKEERIPQDVLDYIVAGNLACVVSRGEPVVFDVFNELEIRLNKRGRHLVYEPRVYDRLYLYRITSVPVENQSVPSPSK